MLAMTSCSNETHIFEYLNYDIYRFWVIPI
jgi:hypothetical protein